jgi:hypothetical protein
MSFEMSFKFLVLSSSPAKKYVLTKSRTSLSFRFKLESGFEFGINYSDFDGYSARELRDVSYISYQAITNGSRCELLNICQAQIVD